MKKFNLIKENWIPTNAGLKSLAAIFREDIIQTVGSNSTETLCLFKFLLAIAQAALRPTMQDLVEISKEEASKKIEVYLEENYEKFWLYNDEGRPFLQFPELKNFDKESFAVSKSIRNIDEKTSSCSDNGKIVYDTDWSADSKHVYSDAEKAVLLVINLGAPLSQKDGFGKKNPVILTKSEGYVKYKKKDGTKGVNSSLPLFNDMNGYLHGFIFCDSILESIVVNLVPEDDLVDYFVLNPYVKNGNPPWEYDSLAEDSPYKKTFYAYLVPMCRFILLDENSDECLYTEGMTYNNADENIGDNPFPLTQPSIFLYETRKTGKNEEEISSKSAVKPKLVDHPLVSLEALANEAIASNHQNLNSQVTYSKNLASQRGHEEVTLLLVGTEYEFGMGGTSLVGYVSSSVDIRLDDCSKFDSLANKMYAVSSNISTTTKRIDKWLKLAIGNTAKLSDTEKKELKAAACAKVDNMKMKLVNSDDTEAKKCLSKFNMFMKNDLFSMFIERRSASHSSSLCNPFIAMAKIEEDEKLSYKWNWQV